MRGAVEFLRSVKDHPYVIDDTREPLEPLSAAPLVEVACGFLFEPVTAIDPVSVGAFWLGRQARFPERALRYALDDGGRQITIGNSPPPLRTWMVSANGETLLQVQRDRLFFNWRSVGPDYPRFSASGGVKDQAIEAFADLTGFLDSTFGERPSVHHVEVLKIDMLEQGIHWMDHPDLATAVPSLHQHLMSGPIETPTLNLRMAGEHEGCTVRLKLDLLDQPGGRALRLETSARSAVEDSLHGAVGEANHCVNRLFSWLIPRAERDSRFQRRDP